MLSCSCNYDEGDFFVDPSGEFIPLATVRARRCGSCGHKIAVGDTALFFRSFRYPRSDYEERRFGDEVPMAPRYLCEECGEIWLNLSSAGFCLSFGHDIRDDLGEYWEMTGFDPKKYQDANHAE